MQKGKNLWKQFQKKQVKAVLSALALVFVVCGVMWNMMKVSALEITNANTNSYAVSGTGTIVDGKIQGTSESNAYIGVYVISNDTKDTRFSGSNLKWANNGSVWSNASGRKVLFESKKEQKISAYYPYVENYADNGVTYSLTQTQSEDTMHKDDLLYAGETPLSSEKVNLTFNHLMTKLSFSVQMGTEIDTKATITSVQISGLAKELTFYPENGNVQTSANMTGKTTLYYNTNSSSYDGLVFPSEQTTMTVTVTLSNNQTFITTVNCPADGLKGGHQYAINLQVGQDTVSVTGVSADNWEMKTGGNLVTE